MKGNRARPTFTCESGNCMETDCPIIISYREKWSGFTKHFCSMKHAADYLLRRIEIRGDVKERAAEVEP